MNRHVGKIDEEISNNTKLLQSLDEKVSSLLQKNTIDTPKATPIVFQGSCSQHTSGVLNLNETPTATIPPRQSASKGVLKESHTLDAVKKNLDMSIDLTLSDDDQVDLNQPPKEGLTINMEGQTEPLKSEKVPKKSTKKRATLTGKDLLKGLEVDFDVSDSDSDDCKIVDGPTQSTKILSGMKDVPKERKTQPRQVCPHTAIVLNLHHKAMFPFHISATTLIGIFHDMAGQRERETGCN